MGSICILKLSALGDLVQADGALRDIRENHPEDQITVVTTPPYENYMIRCPWVDRVLVDPRSSRFNLLKMLNLKKRFQSAAFERVYDLQQVGRTRFYYRWLFPRSWWMGDVPGCTIYLKRDEDRTCAAEHFHSHLQKAELTVKHTLHTDVSWMSEDVSTILESAGLKPGFVFLIPGASHTHQHKRWPHFHELAAQLTEIGKRVVTVPGPDDVDVCSKLAGKMLVPPHGYYDFFILAGVAKHAALVIGNDTGPTHIAAHLGLPGIALFGSHTPSFTTGIQHTNFTVIERNNLAELSFEDVWQHVDAHLPS